MHGLLRERALQKLVADLLSDFIQHALILCQNSNQLTVPQREIGGLQISKECD